MPSDGFDIISVFPARAGMSPAESSTLEIFARCSPRERG